MADDVTKIAKRTLFEAERIKAEKYYKRWLKTIMKKVRAVIINTKDYNELIAKLMQLSASKGFRELCRQAARQTATMLAVGQQKTFREAASLSSQGRRIFQALQKELATTQVGDTVKQIIEDNSRLIQTVPQRLAGEFSRMAAENKYAGLRPDELLDEFKKRAPHLTDTEARRIARTETAKAATALTEARAQKLGLPFYRWLSARDERVRDSHRKMNGVICAWNDPPNPELLADEEHSYGNYHPGGIFNCRCVPIVIVALKDIQFPARVHYHGAIQNVKNEQEFRMMFNGTV